MGDGNVAKQRDLVSHRLRDLVLGPAYDNVCPDPHPLQFPDARLGRFGLEFFRTVQIRHECHVDHAACSLRLLLHELADRLVDGLGFNISDCSAHFDDRDGIISVPCSHIEPALDLICDVGNDLYRSTAVIAPALLIEYRPVYFA